ALVLTGGTPTGGAKRRREDRSTGETNGREGAVHQVLDEGIEDDAQRDLAHPGVVRLPPRSALAHGDGDRLADRRWGEDDHRGTRDRKRRMGARAAASNDEGGARGVRASERRTAESMERA